MPNELREAGSTAPLTTTVNKMADMLGCGLSTAWDLVGGDNPQIKSISIGRRRLPLISSIHEFVERKAAEPRRKLANPPRGQGNKLHRTNREISPKT